MKRSKCMPLAIALVLTLPLAASAQDDEEAPTEPSVSDEVAADEEHGPCSVSGYVYWNGNPVGSGETVLCKGSNTGHTLGTGSDTTNASGYFDNCQAPEKGDGYIHMILRDQDLGHCPTVCTGSTITCDVYGSGSCSNPSATLALMLPPSLLLPAAWRRGRRRRAADAS